MKIAVISDIHGNYEALKAVIADIEKSAIDCIICLGDLVGYGPDSDKVVEYIRNNNIPCVLGNHDLASFDEKVFALFSKDAADSILLTNKQISQRSLEFIKNLPKCIIRDNALFVHGCPPNLVLEYISELSDDKLISIFNELKQDMVFLGHTHALKRYAFDGEEIIKKNIHEGIMPLDKTQKHIVNVGSVGQPRDGNNNAKYVIFDVNDFSIDIRLIPYNIKITADRIKELGFPRSNATRLW